MALTNTYTAPRVSASNHSRKRYDRLAPCRVCGSKKAACQNIITATAHLGCPELERAVKKGKLPKLAISPNVKPVQA